MILHRPCLTKRSNEKVLFHLLLWRSRNTNNNSFHVRIHKQKRYDPFDDGRSVLILSNFLQMFDRTKRLSNLHRYWSMCKSLTKRISSFKRSFDSLIVNRSNRKHLTTDENKDENTSKKKHLFQREHRVNFLLVLIRLSIGTNRFSMKCDIDSQCKCSTREKWLKYDDFIFFTNSKMSCCWWGIKSKSMKLKSVVTVFHCSNG